MGVSTKGLLVLMESMDMVADHKRPCMQANPLRFLLSARREQRHGKGSTSTKLEQTKQGNGLPRGVVVTDDEKFGWLRSLLAKLVKKREKKSCEVGEIEEKREIGE